MMYAHNCRGEIEKLTCGLWECHNMMFADDGFGNLVRADIWQMVQFFN